MTLRTFLRRTPWPDWTCWAVLIAGTAWSLTAGLWPLVVLSLVVLGLTVRNQWLAQLLDDAEAMRDHLAAERDRYLEKAIAYRLRLSVRNPVAHWED